MKMSTRGRYGLRAMLELARCFGDEPLMMGTLAEREGLSRKYLHALLTGLKSAGLVRSVRGAGGGFVLTREPSQIKLTEVLSALEGSLSLVDCVADKGRCDKAERCAARPLWQELSGAIGDVLDNLTLEDLVASKIKARSGPDAKKRVTNRRRPRSEVGRSGASGATARGRRAKASTR